MSQTPTAVEQGEYFAKLLFAQDLSQEIFQITDKFLTSMHASNIAAGRKLAMFRYCWIIIVTRCIAINLNFVR